MISHGSVATHLRCGGIFNDHFTEDFTLQHLSTEFGGEKILKIGQCSKHL